MSQEEKVDFLEDCKIRVSNALWSLFIADALAMPVHWYYNRDNIKQDYGKNGITKYEDANKLHPESFMLGLQYNPDVKKAASLNRKIDYLFSDKIYFSTTLPMTESEQKDHDGLMKSLNENTETESHGRSVASKNTRIHYHCNLKAGDNTVGAQLCRVLLRYIGSLTEKEDYRNREFMQNMIDYLTDNKNDNNDSYSEEYIRKIMENYSIGNDVLQLGPSQEDMFTIGSHGGILRPLIVGIYYFCRMISERMKFQNKNKDKDKDKDKDGQNSNTIVGMNVNININININQCIAMALKHLHLTHKSENLSMCIISLLRLICNRFILNKKELNKELINEFCLNNIYLPKIDAVTLSNLKKESKGPANMSQAQLYKYHTEFKNEGFDVVDMCNNTKNDQIYDENLSFLGTVCEVDKGVPLAMYLMTKCNFDLKQTLLANTNAGGDNVHRGMMLGLIIGSSIGGKRLEMINDEYKQWIIGLKNYQTISKEIDAFVKACFD